MSVTEDDQVGLSQTGLVVKAVGQSSEHHLSLLLDPDEFVFGDELVAAPFRGGEHFLPECTNLAHLAARGSPTMDSSGHSEMRLTFA
ncbi:hypothetical protein [Rhodococcus sp. JVH1]|uniref:hypothetical protein n=1 Tax=Rhodococcus sp. JVH1 TaxID=745408 RepID=UPI0012F6B742|nr:hypothetical protein [Rhodococcus sp. JVH1]